MTWWKEVKLFDALNQPIRAAYIRDETRSASLLIDLDGIDYSVGSIVFSKAGFLGFPVGRFQFGELEALAGTRVDLTWLDPDRTYYWGD